MSAPYNDYFRGRSVLVTGGFGFIGSNLCLRLLELGAHLTVIDHATVPDAFPQLAVIRSKAHVIIADIRNALEATRAVDDQDVIFNLAGTSGAAESNDLALSDLGDNCQAQLTLLEACRAHNPQVAMVFPSTRLVYGKPLRLPVDEQHPLAPESIYAVHKLTVEGYLAVFARSCGMKITVLRIANPYGPLQSPHRRNYGVANRFIQAAVQGERITLFGSGEQRRDYLYIDDLVDALLRSACCEQARNKIYNIGSGEAISVFEIAQAAIEAAGRGGIEQVSWPENYKAIETGDYVSDIRLAERELGWRPTTPLRVGIESTVAFYQNCASGARVSLV